MESSSGRQTRPVGTVSGSRARWRSWAAFGTGLALFAAGLGLVPGTAVAAVRATAAVEAHHSLGAKPFGRLIRPSVARTQALFGVRSTQPAALPASVDLSHDAASPGSQGAVSSCVAWAIGYSIMGWFARHAGHAGSPYAPMYLYSQINGGQDNGSYPSDAFDILLDQGIAEHEVYTQGDYDWWTAPTAAERLDASANKISGYSTLFSWSGAGTTGGDAIRTALAAGQPVALMIPVYQDFDDLNAWNSLEPGPPHSGDLLGYHEIAVFGYDTTGVQIENSWGTAWGDDGWATLSWDFVEQEVVEATTTTGWAPVTEVPVLTGLSTHLVSSTTTSTLTVTADNIAELNADNPAAVQLINAADASVVATTVTDLTSRTVTVTVPAVAQGDYWVRLSNDVGANPDDANYHVSTVATHDAVIAAGTKALATGGTQVDLTGAGFGANWNEFADAGLTATVAGAPVTLIWVDDQLVRITLPGGAPGTRPAIRLYTLGVGGVESRDVTYAADISWLSQATVRRSGQVTVLGAGRGFRNSTAWKLVSASGAKTSLRTYGSRKALNRASSGVYRESDTTIVVKVPKAPRGRGAYRLTFRSTAGASMNTAAAVITYR